MKKTDQNRNRENYRLRREIEFLQDELRKEKKANRYKDHVMEDLLEAWEFSDLYHRPITVGETRKRFNLLRGAIGFREPSYIDKPSGRSNVRTLDSKGRAKKGVAS